MTLNVGALALTVLLCGCGSGAAEWTKPGVNEQATSRAYRDCRSMADATVAPEIGINQDILATRGTDWQRAQVQNQQTRAMAEATGNRAAAIVASCMAAGGFQRAK